MAEKSVEVLRARITAQARRSLHLGNEALHQAARVFGTDPTTLLRREGRAYIYQGSTWERFTRRGRLIGAIDVLVQQTKMGGVTRLSLSGSLTNLAEQAGMRDGDIGIDNFSSTGRRVRINFTGNPAPNAEPEESTRRETVVGITGTDTGSYFPDVTFGIEEPNVYRDQTDISLANLQRRLGDVMEAGEAVQLVRRVMGIPNFLRPFNTQPKIDHRIYIH